MSNERRAALEKAFDASIENTEPVANVEKSTDQIATEIGSLQTAGDLPGKKEPIVAEPVKSDPYQTEAKAVAKSEQAKPDAVNKVAAEPKASSAPASAPVSWKVGEREHWGKIPAEAQAVILRREKEVQQILSSSANARKFEGEFVNAIKPFSHLIHAQNSTPLQAVQNLMTTAAGLTVGSQEQKARIVMEIINNYGVDIPTLDAVLAKGTIPPSAAGQGAISAEVAQALRPVYGFMDEIKQARMQHQQVLAEKAQAEVAEFNPPFIQDVADDMADLMEYAASKGQVMTLQQAYDVAVNLRPDVKKVLDQRAQAAAVQNGGVVRAKRAAASIQGAPLNGAGAAPPAGRRAAFEEAWEAHSR